MRIFLSWSGEQSHKVALALKEWLPNVIQALDPWVSSSDIEKGESWFSAINESLVKAEGMGIFCLTQNNLNAPWLAYEAGSLASQDRARVATFLFGIESNAVKPPLGLFQATVSSAKEDVLRLLTTINSRVTPALSEPRLQRAFETHWQSFADQLAKIPAATASAKKSESDSTALLSEILAVVRRIEKDASSWGPQADSVIFGNPPHGPAGPGPGRGGAGQAAVVTGLLGGMHDAEVTGLLGALDRNQVAREVLGNRLRDQYYDSVLFNPANQGVAAGLLSVRDIHPPPPPPPPRQSPPSNRTPPKRR